MNLKGKKIYPIVSQKDFQETRYFYDKPTLTGKIIKKIKITWADQGYYLVKDVHYMWRPSPYDNLLWLGVETDPSENSGIIWTPYKAGNWKIQEGQKVVPLNISQDFIEEKAEADKPSFLNLPKKLLYGLGVLGVLLILAKKYK